MNSNASHTLTHTGSTERAGSPDQAAAIMKHGEAVTIGKLMLQRTTDDQIRVAVGERAYVVDTAVFERLVDTAVSEHRHLMDDQPHARWCDLRRHAIADAEAVGHHTECAGRLIEVSEPNTGLDVGGWWGECPGDQPRFYVDPDGDGMHADAIGRGDYSLAELREARAQLLDGMHTPRSARVLSLVESAITDFVNGIDGAHSV